MGRRVRDEVKALPLYLEERQLVLEWMLREWETYSNEKFGLVAQPEQQRNDHDESMRQDGFRHLGFWLRQVTQYFSRAQLFGIGEPSSARPDAGQQALLKSLMTLFDCCACMIRVHGLPPEPGVPSGELKEWK